MAGIWIYSETKDVADQLLTEGRKAADALNEKVNVIALPDQDAKDYIAKGADHVVQFSAKNDWPEAYAPAIADVLAKGEPTVAFFGGTLRGKTVAAYVAAKLNAGYANNVTKVTVDGGKVVVERAMYGGKAVGTEELGKGSVVSVEPRTFDAAVADASRTGDVETNDAAVESKVTVANAKPVVHEGGDLASAPVVVSIGRGLDLDDKDKKDMKLAEDLAAKFPGAMIGCSRSVAEDYGWLPADRYIGISGAKVKPQLYIAIGISGQIQHVVGMTGSKVIVAVDRNENAPIFSVCDYGIVGDLHKVVPLLTKALSK